MNDLLKINNLKKSYYSLNGEIKAIEDFSLKIKEGEYISIIGPSGCGKSTILNILVDLIKDYEGNIWYSKDNLRIGYMLQEDTLFDWLTIYDNSILGLKIKHELTKEKELYVKDLLYKYGLEAFLDKYPKDLSGGMRQRVALIRTLAMKPDLLLLDEPFSALDYQTRLKVSDDVYRIIKKENKTVIMVTHDIEEAISLSDKVVIMSKRPGKVKNIYDINLFEKKNPIENRNDKMFSHYYDIFWKELD